MNRSPAAIWPLLVGVLCLALTGWLWDHERQTQQRSLRARFDFALRQTATRIEERMASYEQMLRGLRGLAEASSTVTRQEFSAYVDALISGADSAGLRAFSYLPIPGSPGAPAAAAGNSRPLVYSAPAGDSRLSPLGTDPFADPDRLDAMRQARDSGNMAISQRIRLTAADGSPGDSAFVLFMALYAKDRPHDTLDTRRANAMGWVGASFRVGDLMSSLYGEGMPGLELGIHDGADSGEATRMYASAASASVPGSNRFEALEYIGFAGHTWTLSVRAGPEFEHLHGNDSSPVIAVAGLACSAALALLTRLLVTGRERAHTAAREMTHQLRDSVERYRLIVETANEGIWTVDALGRTTFVNPKLQQMLARTADELRGRCWLDFMDEDGRAAMARASSEQLQQGLSDQREIRFHRPGADDLWTAVSTSPIVDALGRHAGALAMVTDITERKRAEADRAQLEYQLRQSQKMEAIGTLAGGIAHDFNNLLAAILGNAALARDQIDTEHPVAAPLEQVRLAAARGRSLVQQIAAFSRRQPQERLSQPLRPLLEEAATLMRSTLPALVELELQLSDVPLRVSADATQIQQVVMNLCTNAWHAMTGGTGHIVIGLALARLDAEQAARLGGLTTGEHAHVWVGDDGCGMDEATRQRIFEPFFTTKPVGKGTGLGLSVVHGIVSAHDGAITVSSAPQQGSRFDLYFPLAAVGSAASAGAAAQDADLRGGGEHVLYVDDEPVMLVMVEALLLRLGYRVSCCADPLQAPGLVAKGGIDLVVTDFNMPEMSGLALALLLRAQRPDLPVILTSGYITDALRADALRAGLPAVLQKEYTLERLGALIHQTLEARAAASQRG